MNVLLVIADTLRADYLSCYGNEWVRTPHLDALAREACLFRNFFCASFPTRPMRKDLHSGRYTFAYTSWRGDWERGEVPLARVLRSAGFQTALIGDTPSNGGFEHGFDHFEMILGQAHDMNPDGDRQKIPASLRKLRGPAARIQRLLRNAALFRGEEDRYVAQTMRAAYRWLESTYGGRKPFFLLVDTFDPHEPWNPPQHYVDLYAPKYRGDVLFEPAYEPAGYASATEVRHMRRLYAAEVTLVDRWIGYLLEGLKRLRAWDETLVIVASDHGFYHGEHGLIGKVNLDRRNVIRKRWPLYRTIARAPLLIKLPGQRRGRRSAAFCQPPDLMPTICELAGTRIPKTVQGTSLAPFLRGERTPRRRAVVSSYGFTQDIEVRAPSSYRTTRYLYVYGGDEWEHELYDVRADPAESHNIISERPAIAEKLHGEYLQFLRAIGCPAEYLAGREPFRPRRRRNLPKHRVI